jgi:hypothetical protein
MPDQDQQGGDDVLAIPVALIRARAEGLLDLPLLVEAHADVIRPDLAALHPGRERPLTPDDLQDGAGLQVADAALPGGVGRATAHALFGKGRESGHGRPPPSQPDSRRLAGMAAFVGIAILRAPA